MGIAPQFFGAVGQDEGSRVGEHVPDRSVVHALIFLKNHEQSNCNSRAIIFVKTIPVR